MLGLFLATAAAVAPLTDDDGSRSTNPLTRCLVAHASPADRTALARLVFGFVSVAPQISGLFAITPERRAGIEHDAEAVFHRLLRTDCHGQAVAAVREGGDEALGDAFGGLVDQAADDLLADPAMTAALGRFAGRLNEDARALGAEAAGGR